MVQPGGRSLASRCFRRAAWASRRLRVPPAALAGRPRRARCSARALRVEAGLSRWPLGVAVAVPASGFQPRTLPILIARWIAAASARSLRAISEVAGTRTRRKETISACQYNELASSMSQRLSRAYHDRPCQHARCGPRGAGSPPHWWESRTESRGPPVDPAQVRVPMAQMRPCGATQRGWHLPYLYGVQTARRHVGAHHVRCFSRTECVQPL